MPTDQELTEQMKQTLREVIDNLQQTVDNLSNQLLPNATGDANGALDDLQRAIGDATVKIRKIRGME